MHTYTAGKADARELRYAGTREWVFPLLPTRRYRDRVGLLSDLELKRRPDCEPTLRALVTDDWSPETLHHIGWCDSCRSAGFALGAGAFAGGRAAPAPNRGRAAMVAAIAVAAIAIPAVGSQVIGNPFDGGQADAVRGGLAVTVHKTIVPRSRGTHTTSPGTKTGTTTKGAAGAAGASGAKGSSGSSGANGSAGPADTTGTSGVTTPKPPAKIIPKQRSRPLGGGIPAHHAHIVPQMRVAGPLPHTT